MTGFMHEKEFSRKTFLKGGGALDRRLQRARRGRRQASAANGNTPFGERGPADFLPDSDAGRLVDHDHADNTVIVTHGETELGHGTPTGILMLAAEEMNMNMIADEVCACRVLAQRHGRRQRQRRHLQPLDARSARRLPAKQTLLSMASTKLGVPAASLTVTDGVVSGGGKSVKYGDLLGGKLFNGTMLDQQRRSRLGRRRARAIAKPVATTSVVGKSFPRIDIPAKVMGTYTYIQNVRVPGMLHARVVRPRGAGANTVENDKPLSVDATSISHIPGAQVVQINELHRRRGAEGIRRDSGGCAAEGRPGRPIRASRLRQLLGLAAERGDTNTQNPPRYTADTGTSRECSPARRRRSRRPTSTTTTASCRSARTARSPT